MICLGVFLFGPNLFGFFCSSWTSMSSSFTKLGNFSLIIFSNNFSISWSSSSPSGLPMIWMLVHLEMFLRILILSLLCFVFRDFIYLLLERGEERKKGRETSLCKRYMIGCLSHAPNWGPGLQPKHVP